MLREIRKVLSISRIPVALWAHQWCFNLIGIRSIFVRAAFASIYQNRTSHIHLHLVINTWLGWHIQSNQYHNERVAHTPYYTYLSADVMIVVHDWTKLDFYPWRYNDCLLKPKTSWNIFYDQAWNIRSIIAYPRNNPSLFLMRPNNKISNLYAEVTFRKIMIESMPVKYLILVKWTSLSWRPFRWRAFPDLRFVIPEEQSLR